MSALAPTSLEVVELDEALDFDPPCDHTGCERPVVWIATWHCCGMRDLSCQRHRDNIEDWLRYCECEHTVCDNPVRSIAWEPYRKGDR